MSSKISQLTGGGLVQPGDEIPVARSVAGTPTNFSVTAGTAAAKAASDATKATLASVSGTTTVGHIAVFADIAGTIVDGGAVPSGGGGGSGITALTGDVTAGSNGVATVVKINGQAPATVATSGSYADLSNKPTIPTVGTAAAKAASDSTKATLASVSGSTVIGHIATFADVAGTLADGGALATVATTGSYNDLLNKPTATGFNSSQILGTYGFYDFLNGATVAADAGPQIQAFLLAAQLKAYALGGGSLALDDQMQRNYIVAELPRGNYQTSIPIIVPEQVAIRFQGTIVRLGQHGTATSSYTGDVTSQALANLVQPAVIITPNAHVLDNLDVYCNSNGSDKGSGVAIGKNWYANSVTPAVPGTGYTVGDVITFPQVSKPPYFPIKVVVTAINGSGGITATSLPNAGGSNSVGSYALPPLLQQLQWTAANGFTGSIANNSIGKVFDPAHAGYFVTSGGTGTGAEFTVAWQPDFAGSGSLYNMGLGLIGDTIIENITVNGIGNISDATYGPMFGTLWGGLNYEVSGQIETIGGYYGTYLAGASDFHGGTITAVNAAHAGIKVAQGGSISFKAIIDSPMNVGMAIDGTSQINVVKGSYGIQFNQPGITGAAFVVIGADSGSSGPSSQTSALNLDMTLQNCGSTGTTPAIYLAYIDDSSTINLEVSNTNYQDAAQSYPNTLFAQFGGNVSNAVRLGGSIDRVAGTLFSGTVPDCGINVWDGSISGTAGPGGLYTIYGTGAPISGTSGTGLNKAVIGSTYTDLATGLKYNQTGAASSPAWAVASGGVTGSKATLVAVIQGNPIATGIVGDLVVPYACTINSVELLADQSGSIVVDIWKAAYANYPPTIANTITAADLPTLASQAKNQDTSLTGWTTTVNAADILRFNVDSAATCQRVTLVLNVTKS